MITAVISISVFLVVIVIHEVAHGYAAYLLGDSTAKDAGRLSLNPLVHIDIIGTVVLPVILFLTKSPVIFGWANPVPINPYNFRRPRLGLFLSSLAGPASNFILAVIFAALLKLKIFAPETLFWLFLLYGAYVSLVLGIFNLVPIPPLDGANILISILPARFAAWYMSIERYGLILLIVLLYCGLFNKVILPLTQILIKLILV
ncbi:MAG: site-2 protease family protein [Candidatus Omnitrophica bacterium]|nr:site-2 protease family protein [Candidatus Omnitrophota bacterium]